MPIETFDAVAHSSDTAFALSVDWTLVRTNDGWKRFALENGGAEVLERWPVGACIKGAIPSVLRGFYGAAFDHVHSTGQHWAHDYECSAPDVYRLMHMVVYPLEPGLVLVVSSPTIERNVHSAVSVDRADYEHQGLMVTCAHCRKFRNYTSEGVWDWVPELMRNPPEKLSHGLCPVCFEHYFPA